MNMNSTIERQFREEARQRGYEIFWKGYPDYVIVKGDEIIFVECKKPLFTNGRGQHLKRHQKSMKIILEKIGAKVKIYRGEWDIQQ